MGNVWVLSALWVGLALVATLLAIWFRLATALLSCCCRNGERRASHVSSKCVLPPATPFAEQRAGREITSCGDHRRFSP